AVDETGFTVTRRRTDHEYFLVTGDKPERWVHQTNFANDEAVGYLADRLARLGVEEALFRAGATPGAEVVIGDGPAGVVFYWEATWITGAELLGGCGTDARMEDRHRPTRAERRQEFHDRMDAKTAAREELWTQRDDGRRPDSVWRAQHVDTAVHPVSGCAR